MEPYLSDDALLYRTPDGPMADQREVFPSTPSLSHSLFHGESASAYIVRRRFVDSRAGCQNSSSHTEILLVSNI